MEHKIPTRPPDKVFYSFIRYWKLSDHIVFQVPLKDGMEMVVALANTGDLAASTPEIEHAFFVKLLKMYGVPQDNGA